MTKITRNNNIRTGDVASDSSPKTPADSAILAQQLGSESSWADRYVPPTPGSTIMTPSSSISIADQSERSLDTEFMTPNDAPPTYEEVTSSGTPSHAGSSRPRGPHPTFQPPRRPNLPGRRYSRHETSTSITGTFTLHDSLNLSTTSGTISITLDVQPGDEPAHLTLKTQSGSVSLHDKQADTAMSRSSPTNRSSSRSSGGGSGLFSFLLGSRSNQTQIQPPPIPTSDDPRKQPGQNIPQPEQPTNTTPPARVILTTIETSSGSVNGQLLITATSKLSVTTESGSMSLRLITADSSCSSSSTLNHHPLTKLEAEDSQLTDTNATATKDLKSTLTTTSNSGSQHISITTGHHDTSAGALISAIQASHHSRGSSSVHCSYPREWMGLVHASVGGSGTVNVHGDGLQLDRRGSKEVWAWRGRGDDLPDVERAVEVRCDGSGTVNFGC